MVLDTHQFAGLMICAAFSLAILTVPGLVRSRAAMILAVMAAALYYRREFVGFALISAIAYLLTSWISRQTVQAYRWRLACFLMVTLVVIFTSGRIWHWDRLWQFPLTGPIALYSLGMWPVLKLVTLLWEIGSGTATNPSPSQYALWVCLPFTISGPVLRWSEMPGALLPDIGVFKAASWWSAAAAATAKMTAGLMLGPGQAWVADHWHSHLGVNAVSTFVTGPLNFYLTAAGYFQWMQLLAMPCGIKVGDSFNFPIGRENISAFWMNWNMTATFVFRDYLFYNRWGGLTYNIYLNTVLLFTLVGLWHAANWYWIIWGGLHGLLFVAYLLWRKYNYRLRFLPLRGTRASNIAARVLTYFSVCMCWYLPSKILQKVAAL